MPGIYIFIVQIAQTFVLIKFAFIFDSSLIVFIILLEFMICTYYMKLYDIDMQKIIVQDN